MLSVLQLQLVLLLAPNLVLLVQPVVKRKPARPDQTADAANLLPWWREMNGLKDASLTRC
jgi:hypothetical protein